MIKKTFIGLTFVTCFSIFYSDAEAQAMMSPQEMLGIVIELLEEYTAQEETLSNDENRIFEDKTYDDSLGQYANPAGMETSVDYQYVVDYNGSLVPLEMSIHSNVITGDDAYQFLDMNDAYQLFDQMNEQEEWIIIEFELEVIDDGEFSDVTHELSAEDFYLYLANSPDTNVYEPIYNDYLFESVMLQPGDEFEGMVAKRVPKYTDFTLRFGTGEESGHVFWYFYAEENPYMAY